MGISTAIGTSLMRIVGGSLLGTIEASSSVLRGIAGGSNLLSSFHTLSHGRTVPGGCGSGTSSLTFRRAGKDNPIGLEVIGSRLRFPLSEA